MPKNIQGAEMHPKTARQQNPQQTNNQPATQARKHTSSTQTRASMTTEYQERFLPPCYFMAITSSSTKKNPYHPLKGTSDDITSLRSFYVMHKKIKKPPKVPQPPEPEPPKNYRRCRSIPVSAANQTPSKVDFTSVYQNDFKQWEASKRQPFILKDSLTIKHGLANTLSHKQEPEPIESTTSYKSAFVRHPVQPRPVKMKHSNQSSNDLPLEPRLPFNPKRAWSTHQDILDKAGEFFEKFNSCSLEAKFQGHTKDFTSPEAHDAHCQVSVQNLPATEKSDVPCQAATTMTEDCRVWDTPQSFTTVKTTLSVDKPKSTDNCKESPKTSQHPKINKTAACNSTRGATQRRQSPEETELFSGFECTTGNGESKVYWYSNSVDGGGPWPEGNNCTDQTVGCMVSSRS